MELGGKNLKKPSITGPIRSTALSVANMIMGQKNLDQNTLDNPNFASTRVTDQHKQDQDVSDEPNKDVTYVEKYYTERKETLKRECAKEKLALRDLQPKKEETLKEYLDLQDKIKNLTVMSQEQAKNPLLENKAHKNKSNVIETQVCPKSLSKHDFDASLNLTTIKSTDKRIKILESFRRYPIDNWSQDDGNLYVFLKTKAEPYFRIKSLTKAETILAISYIFQDSLWAESRATEIAEKYLPDVPECTAEQRNETYKMLARELGSISDTTIEPLGTNERTIDLFYRVKLGIEGAEIGDICEQSLNYEALRKMMCPQASLMPEDTRNELKLIWLNRVDGVHRKIEISTILAMLTRFDRATALFDRYE